MLQSIRDRSQGLIVGVIVFLISLTFALWGIQSYVDAGSRVIVAEAAGDEILLDEFQDSLQRLRRQAQSLLGEEFDASVWDNPATRQRALEELINERLVLQLANDARIRISDVQVARQLHQIPAFQDENGFSRALYAQRVPQLGFTESGFEQRLREDMARAQVRAGVAASEFVTREEAERIQRLREQKRDIGYAIIPAAEFADEVAIGDDELAAYYAENKEDFRVPEKVSLAYLEISLAEIAEEVAASEEALRQYYEANRAAYSVAEERNVNHILIAVPSDADDQAQVDALAKVADARARAIAGEPFEELAKELSDDVGSSADGGETGLFGRGVMAPEFEEAAFSLEVGEVSQPVRTRFGYHLLKLKEIKPGGTKTFAEAREEVERNYREIEAQKIYFDRAEQFSNLVYEHPNGLDVAAEALGLEVQTTDSLTREEIAALFSERVAASAFEPEVLLEGLNAEPVELPDGRVVALRVAEHSPSFVPELENIRDEVETALRDDKLRELTRLAGEAMIERLKAGETVAEVVTDKGFGWETALGVKRDSDDVNRAVLRAAFKTDVGDSAPLYRGVPIGRTDFAVVRIANVVTPGATELDDGEVDELQQTLARPRAELAWRDFLATLRQESEVEVFEENL